MSYLFENLSSERFQELCQVLVLKEFPGVQCLPVNQPDGGRDILSWENVRLLNTASVVFQVKQTKNKSAKDPVKEIRALISKEKQKIEKLIERGMERYILITNIKGSAHLDGGTIDKVRQLLADNISVPSQCWWYDDIARRVELDINTKWSYPEILDGQDILNCALYMTINENLELRKSAINAYLADQYEIDNEVKFKQIDLQNRLVELYTDVSISPKSYDKKSRVIRKVLNIFRMDEFSRNAMFGKEEVESVGVATFLLSKLVQENIERVLLEGGPGQGKSTVSQYICQVNRVKLLKKGVDLKYLPDSIKAFPTRLPFKVDLRHVADWVNKSDPYGFATSKQLFEQKWVKSLEVFLVWHIMYHSQVDEFKVTDLFGVMKNSPVLLVFDGFDEIADMYTREEVISFINEGVNRLKQNCLSIQVIVTSRPSVFSDKYSFPIELYPHFELCDLSKDQTKEYVAKWSKANRLDRHEIRSIDKLVNDKLEMDHLRELAKSPMQLAIFISLLRTKGESLPNKRTALFDSYIGLFFDRESEKSSIVRDNRDLIIELHKYLAWVIHSEAELFNNSGIIDVENLKGKLKQFLENEGHQTNLADQLFDAVKDRVCALASRVQGTFEFEVQPLREYFCAKYLYETSPYSPAGNEKKNALPDRFHAISRNFYWQNVVRFFSGCLNKGELPMLVSELKDLNQDSLLRYTNYPKLLTSQLLSDYVFTQYPKLLHEVIKLIIDGIAGGNVVGERHSLHGREVLTVPNDCGRSEIVKECLVQLKKFPKRDYSQNLIAIIRNNPSPIHEEWALFAYKLTGNELTHWLEYGYDLGIVYKLPEDVVQYLLNTSSMQELEARVAMLINGNCTHPIMAEEKYRAISLELVLNFSHGLHQRQSKNGVTLLSWILHPFLMGEIMTGESRYGIVEEVYYRFYLGQNKKGKNFLDFEVVDEIDENIKSFFDSIDLFLKTKVSDLIVSLSSWNNLIENGRKIFGDAWIFTIVGVIASSIRSKEEKCAESSDLLDGDLPLCERYRYARLQTNNLRYWQTIFSLSASKDVLLIFFTWANSRLIVKLLPTLEDIFSKMPEEEYLSLVQGLSLASIVSKNNLKKVGEEVLSNSELEISDRIVILISYRLPPEYRAEFLKLKVSDDSELNGQILQYRLALLESDMAGKNAGKEDLLLIKKLYSRINYSGSRRMFYGIEYLEFGETRLDLDLSREVMEECKDYPLSIAFLAEQTCSRHASKNIVPVGKTAADDLWFEEL